jgi:hypothetical protein
MPSSFKTTQPPVTCTGGLTCPFLRTSAARASSGTICCTDTYPGSPPLAFFSATAARASLSNDPPLATASRNALASPSLSNMTDCTFHCFTAALYSLSTWAGSGLAFAEAWVCNVVRSAEARKASMASR